jgi:arylsulfatase A-like enzyme
MRLLLLVALSFAEAFHHPQSLLAQSTKPNIIIVFADDLGYGELGCYGQKKIRTPNLDAMAAEGIRFTDFYSSSAICAASRAQLLTGLHAGHAAIRSNVEMAQGPSSFTDDNEKGQMPLPADAVTIAERLKSAGYATACVGKWGLGMSEAPGGPTYQGFDYFFGYLDQKQAHNYYPTHLWENGVPYPLKNGRIDVHTKLETPSDSAFSRFIGKEYSIDVMREKALGFLSQHKRNPFFLYYALTLPHLALQAPPEAVAEYAGQFEETPYLGSNGYCPVKYPRSTYAAMVTYLDTQVGILRQWLRDQGLERNTVIIFTSDNGSAFEIGGADPAFFNTNGPLRGHKGSLYEGGIRVPMIASWPGTIKPGISQRLAAQYDFVATAEELAGLNTSPTDGISLVPEFMGKRSQEHPYLYFELAEYSGQQAIRMGKWKAIRRNLIKDPRSPWELYDLTSSDEAINIADKFPSILKTMIAIAQEQHQPGSIPVWNFIKSSQ